MEQQSSPSDHNFNSISPSAKSLLLMKGLTDIPFAKEGAKLIMYPEAYSPDAGLHEAGTLARVVHFENRYWSIDQLLAETGITNILEISSGYSFRGLHTVQHNEVHYIDTDLPELTAVKKNMAAELGKQVSERKGVLEILPLNAMDETEFERVIALFPEGPIVIINEGLLMYLSEDEKLKLTRIIHTVLKKRGGFWITADIYIKRDVSKLELKINEHQKEFFKKHQIEENWFESFEEAENFFRKAGFVIDKEAEVNPSKLSSMKFLLKNINPEHLKKLRAGGKIQATWRLKLGK